MALQLGGWDTKEQECSAELEPGARTTVRDKGEQRKVEGNEETGREMTLFFLSSSKQGLLCPQEPLGFLS